MNYLKKYESFQTNEEIHQICDKYDINNYTINSDGSIDVNGDVNLVKMILEKLPLKFNHVSGYFDCSHIGLTTLEGAPQSVGGDFYCHFNKLNTLKGVPQSVKGNFSCYSSELTTLKGAPQYVSGYFNCSSNYLTTLEGAPQYVSDYFSCSNNKLTTLEGAPKSVDGIFSCYSNKLTTLKGAPKSVGGNFLCSYNQLTTLEGAPQSVDGNFVCSYNKYLKSLNYLPKYIHSEKVDFEDTAVYEIFKLLDNFSLGAIRYVNDLKVVVDDKINIEILNDILYDQGKSPVEKVIGYSNLEY